VRVYHATEQSAVITGACQLACGPVVREAGLSGAAPEVCPVMVPRGSLVQQGRCVAQRAGPGG
jgi:hypothetical protein